MGNEMEAEEFPERFECGKCGRPIHLNGWCRNEGCVLGRMSMGLVGDNE